MGRRLVAVLSNKGGVGKTTVAVALAYALRSLGFRVGLADVDFSGPNVLEALGVSSTGSRVTPDGIVPLDVDGVRVFSIEFLLRDRLDPVAWGSVDKAEYIRSVLVGGSVVWGDVDFIVVDGPPGTSTDVLEIVSLSDHIVVVTTPHKMALLDARKLVRLVEMRGKKVDAVVVNMCGLYGGCDSVSVVPGVEHYRLEFRPEYAKDPRLASKSLELLARRLAGVEA